MARISERDRYRDDAPPRPVGQALWLLATVAIAAVIMSAMGDALTAADGASRAGAFSGQDLLDLADGADRIDGAHRDDTTEGDDWAGRPASPTPAAPAIAEPTDGTNAVDRADDLIFEIDPADPAGGTLFGRSSEADRGSDTRSSAATPTDPTLRGEAALATISYPWRELLPGWTITFLPERDGLYGLTLVPEQRIEIYVRRTQSTVLLAHVIAHELGHAVDVTLNDSQDRRRWEASRGIESDPWWPGSGATDFSTGAGDFAESFAAWQTGGESFRSKLADPPSPDQINLLAQLSAG